MCLKNEEIRGYSMRSEEKSVYIYIYIYTYHEHVEVREVIRAVVQTVQSIDGVSNVDGGGEEFLELDKERKDDLEI